jgi:cysteinyl-tRNA synthetase
MRFQLTLLACAALVTGCARIPDPAAASAIPAGLGALGPRHQRGIEGGAFLAFRGRADQMGDLRQVAASYQIIAVDADPSSGRFSREDLAILHGGGRNAVLGFVDIGFCDRTRGHWATAPEGLLPCVANLQAQIAARNDRPQQTWMDPEDVEYQRLIGEYVAPRVASSGVDGFLLGGLDLLDHGPEDDVPCDQDCVAGGLGIVAGLRKEFPDLIFVMEGGLSWIVRGARVGHTHLASMIDGVVGEGIYAPTFQPGREADLLEWKLDGEKVASAEHRAFAVFTEDYVNSCQDVAGARAIWQSSRARGFSPSVGMSPISRGKLCRFD